MTSKPIDTSARNARILELYNAGMTMKDIAAEVGVSANYPGMILKSMGIERPSKPQVFRHRPSADAEKVVALWNQGLSVKHIAERLGVTSKCVHNILLTAGIVRAGAPRWAYESHAGAGGGIQRVARRT